MTFILQVGILCWCLFLIVLGGYMAINRQLPTEEIILHAKNTRLIGILLVGGGLFISIGTVIGLVIGSTTLSRSYVLVTVIPVFVILFSGSADENSKTSSVR